MNLEFARCCLNISPKLYAQLNKVLENESIDVEANHITVNFRDSSYSALTGGYHPVEIAFQKDGENEAWSLLYITDFCYYGSPYAELVKEVDFDFSAGTLYLLNSPSMFIRRSTVKSFYRTWESNFLTYVEIGAFNEIEVSSY